MFAAKNLVLLLSSLLSFSLSPPKVLGADDAQQLAAKQAQWAHLLSSQTGADALHLIYFVGDRIRRCQPKENQADPGPPPVVIAQLTTAWNQNYQEERPQVTVKPEFEALLEPTKMSREQYNTLWTLQNCAPTIQPMVAKFEEAFIEDREGIVCWRSFRLHRLTEVALRASLFNVRGKLQELFGDLCMEDPLAFDEFVSILWTGFSLVKVEGTEKAWLTVPMMRKLLWSIPGVARLCKGYVKVTKENNCKLLDPAYLPSKVEIVHSWTMLGAAYPASNVNFGFQVEEAPLPSGYHQDYISFGGLMGQLAGSLLFQYERQYSPLKDDKEMMISLKETLPLVVIGELEVFKRSVLLLLLGKSNWALNLKWPAPPKLQPQTQQPPQLPSVFQPTPPKRSKSKKKTFEETTQSEPFPGSDRDKGSAGATSNLKIKVRRKSLEKMAAIASLGLFAVPALGYLLSHDRLMRSKHGDKNSKQNHLPRPLPFQSPLPPVNDIKGSSVLAIFLVLFALIGIISAAVFLYFNAQKLEGKEKEKKKFINPQQSSR
ncbi:hypothetical protein TYRP_015314 [Tyrophagus putrescentiae]|nr:hypothetical protein TYRP_015314 [Tyrophagus putrescentiae]